MIINHALGMNIVNENPDLNKIFWNLVRKERVLHLVKESIDLS